MPAADVLRIQVVSANPQRHRLVELRLPPGATAGDAVREAGLPMDGIAGLAVFGRRADPDTPLVDGDRVELLRPLLIDPKDSRRRRAASASAKRTGDVRTRGGRED